MFVHTAKVCMALEGTDFQSKIILSSYDSPQPHKEFPLVLDEMSGFTDSYAVIPNGMVNRQ